MKDALQSGGDHYTFHNVIATAVFQKHSDRLGAAFSLPRIHRDQLFKTPPRFWKDLKSHPLGTLFLEDAHLEVRNLIKKGAWRYIKRELRQSEPIPLKWVFDYKFDADGFLTRCKSRLCVRGDLQ